MIGSPGSTEIYLLADMSAEQIGISRSKEIDRKRLIG